MSTGFKGVQNMTGKPKGAVNKTTKAIKEAFQLLVENNLPQLERDMASLEPKDRLRFIIDFAGFVIPKLKAIELNDISNDFKPIEIQFTQSNINKLEDEN